MATPDPVIPLILAAVIVLSVAASGWLAYSMGRDLGNYCRDQQGRCACHRRRKKRRVS